MTGSKVQGELRYRLAGAVDIEHWVLGVALPPLRCDSLNGDLQLDLIEDSLWDSDPAASQSALHRSCGSARMFRTTGVLPLHGHYGGRVIDTAGAASLDTI